MRGRDRYQSNQKTKLREVRRRADTSKDTYPYIHEM